MRSVFLLRPGAAELEGLGAAKRFLLVWLPAFIGMAAIAAESTATFSAANTSLWLRPVAERLFGHMGTREWEEFHHMLRKTGHFTGYGTLCVLFLRSWLLTFSLNAALRTRVWWWRSWIFAVVSTFLVASADEFHQSFLPSRTGLFSDVLLDTCGGIMLSALVLGLSWLAVRSHSTS